MNDTPTLPGLEDDDSLPIAAVWNAPNGKLATLIKAGRLDPKTDFMRGDFRGWPFAGQDVRGIDFTGSDLRGTGIEHAIRDETTILTDAILDDTPLSPPQTRMPTKKMHKEQPGKEGQAWSSDWHWHAGVHQSFGNKLYLIRLRFITGSIFVKDSIIRDLISSGVSDYMIFNLFSPWDISIRAWADEKSRAALEKNFKDNGEVDTIEKKPEFLEVSEISHFPDRRKKYPSNEEVRAALTMIPTEELKDVQEKGRSSAFFDKLMERGLILDNDIRWTSKRIQFYISIERTRSVPEELLRRTLRGVVRESREISNKTVYLISGGDPPAIVKGQVLKSDYYDIHEFLKRLTKELQETLHAHIKTETTLVANRHHVHSALIDFGRAIRLPSASALSLAGETISKGEGVGREFKSTLRVNLDTHQNDPRMEFAVLKTIAAFLNSNGGTLIIGVDDHGKPLGIKADNFSSEDRMNLHLVNLITGRIGAQHMIAINPRFEDYEGVRVMVVECNPGPAPAFVKDGGRDQFFIRTGAATKEISGPDMQEFIKHRFR